MIELVSVTVEKRDGTSNTYEIFPEAMAAIEAFTGIGFFQVFAPENQKLNNFYYCAWAAEKDNGNVVKPFEQYRKELRNVRFNFPKAEDSPYPEE